MNRAFTISVGKAQPRDFTLLLAGIPLADHLMPLEKELSRSQFSIRSFTMNEHENVNVVKDAYRAFGEGNLDELLAVLDESVKWFSIGPPHLIPTAGTRYGPEQVEQYFSLLRSSGQLKGCWPLEFIAEGDKVVTIGEWLSEVRASGSLIRSPWVHVFTLRDGKICEFRSFYDTAAVISGLESAQPRTGRRSSTHFEQPVIY
jgi:ketosteroid isomerase-like protein